MANRSDIMQNTNITPRGRSHDKPLSRAYRALPKNGELVANDSSPSSSHGELDDTSPLSISVAFQTTPTLPLTPPSIPLDSQGHTSSSQSSGGLNTPVQNVSGNATPTRRINLLTPDITPPRVVSHLRKREGLAQHQPSMSSRAESFTTAREGSSDEDIERSRNVNTRPLQAPKHKLPHPLRNTAVSSKREPPAALSLTNEESPQTKKSQPKSSNTRSVEVTNEARMGRGNEVSAPLPGKKKHRRANSAVSANSARSGLSNGSTRRDRSLKERIHVPRDYPDDSTIDDFGRKIGWISNNDNMDMGEQVQDWRMSGISATSTIEAVVIDTPPQKQRTLRHSMKRESLRSISAPVPRSHRDNSAKKYHDHPQRLVHKSRRLSNENRSSIASDISAAISVGSERPKQKEEIIPVVVIPERRSSLKSSLPSSRRNSRSRSVASARRPATAPDSGTRPFEGSRRRGTFSESVPTGLNVKGTGRHTFEPKIPKRRSSLSAPTSRNVSRAGSLTADSVPKPEAHKLPSAPRNEVKEASQTDSPLVAKKPTTAKVNNMPVPSIEQALSPQEEFLRFQTPPTPWTSFQASVQSLSPGPVEISEARLVPFFSHNNESLMVVERYPHSETRTAHGLNRRGTAMDPPHTPVQLNDPGVTDVDSPLRNPRPPPTPPAFKVIPPTPLARPTHRLGNLPSQSSDSSNGLTRRFGSMRRALSGRRNSEPSSPPPTHRFRNRKAGKELDSKLHPFWRPRGFWEDFDGDGNNNTSHHTRSLSLPTRTDTDDDDHYIGNSLGLPQKRVAFQGPLTLIRRVSKRNRNRNNTRPTNGSHTSLTSLGSRRSGISSRRYGKAHGSSSSSVRLPLTLRRLHEWAIRTREQREQARLEARRDEIRKNIGGKFLVNQSLIHGAGPNHHITVNNVPVT